MSQRTVLCCCFIFFLVLVGGLMLLKPALFAAKFHGLALAWGGKVFGQYFFNPEFWAVIALTLVLERWIPAVPAQRSFGRSFFQDGVWFLYEAVLGVIVTGTYVVWLKAAYARHFEFLTLRALEPQPLWLRVAVSILLFDFLFWLQHWINHKVPWFWRLHAVHHSQRQLNFFTDFRYHALEYLVRSTVLVVPFLLLKIETPVIVGFAFFQRWYTRFYHGNIRGNLGPLRYLLVTPQSHRIHHSVEARHFDKNFGSIFSIWDYLFLTQYRGYDEYPAAGIQDADFPLEAAGSPWRLWLAPLLQHLYPLGKMMSPLRRARRSVGQWGWLGGFKVWLLLAATTVSLLGFPHRVHADAETRADLRLRGYLAKVLPPRGLSLDCVDLFVEASSRKAIDYAVRERHGGACPGDPATAPIVDRYRVMERPWRLQRYDPIEDRWLAPMKF